MNKLSAEWLQARSEIVAILVREGIVETKNGSAGFWRGEEWVSIYELMEENND
jgi:hypothetical protein